MENFCYYILKEIHTDLNNISTFKSKILRKKKETLRKKNNETLTHNFSGILDILLGLII